MEIESFQSVYTLHRWECVEMSWIKGKGKALGLWCYERPPLWDICWWLIPVSVTRTWQSDICNKFLIPPFTADVSLSKPTSPNILNPRNVTWVEWSPVSRTNNVGDVADSRIALATCEAVNTNEYNSDEFSALTSRSSFGR